MPTKARITEKARITKKAPRIQCTREKVIKKTNETKPAAATISDPAASKSITTILNYDILVAIFAASDSYTTLRSLRCVCKLFDQIYRHESRHLELHFFARGIVPPAPPTLALRILYAGRPRPDHRFGYILSPDDIAFLETMHAIILDEIDMARRKPCIDHKAEYKLLQNLLLL